MVAMTDDEQKEQLKSFAKRYGSPIVTGVLLALSVAFGWQWWDKNKTVTAANATVQYQNVLNQAQKAAEDEAAFKALKADADKIVAEFPDTVQALQAQLLVAQLAFDRQDFKTAAETLTQASSSKIKDEGLIAIAKLRLAYTQVELKQLDAALKTLDEIKIVEFTPSVQEARGDIYVQKQDVESAKKAYQQAWDALVKREQPRELLQIKLANLGVVVEEPVIPTAIETPAMPVPSES